MRLDSLPLEMLNGITCAVDSRTDLLSFALACRSLYSAIAPSQLQYYDIRSPLCMPALWKRLAHPDDLHASMVRSLTILYNNRAFAGLDSLVGDAAGEERLPQEYSGFGESPTGKPAREIDLLREWEGDMILALKRMKNLRRFRWYRRTPVIQGENDIWTTLRILSAVRDVQFVDLQCRSGRAQLNTPPIIVSLSFLSLRGLSSLDIRREETTSASTTEDVALLLKMLVQNCYDMKSLHLHFNLSINSHGASIDFLIQKVDWPNLRDLYLHGFTCQTSLLSSFLDRHISIEHLTLSRMTLDSGWQYLTLSDGALPSLHTLDCQSPVAAAILKNPKVAVNLQSLQGIDFMRTVHLAPYTSWDDGVEGDGGDLGEGEQVESPWTAQLADALRTRPSIMSLGPRV
ncbi:hypothetical protein NEOLEDRAFT_344482 [Neolentinus lepideus HHB14362 ss-1]|uniref:F-box domain-containing protein n=1 Tax=Neolentinus lepideus HHB14362 ss-1 TaxID=1314782 RepID=A0A165SPJ2_9AGAM|nr:hypothetical protein NEOLEDRAFT_344482 [Neolentinus lepideus HHB14362 ss-1]